MRTIFANRLIGGALLGASLVTTAQAATTWTVVTPWPESNFHVKNLRDFAERVEEVTDGEVMIEVHAGGDLGLRGPELLTSVRDGIIQGADMLLTQQVGDAPLLGVESVPYLTRNPEDAALLRSMAWPYYEGVAAQFNQKFLYTVPWPGQGVFSNRPVEKVDDLRGLRLRTVDKNGTDFFNALGASPIQMPWGEVIPAFASGAIDGVATSSPSGVDGSFWDFAKYFNKLDWQLAPDVLSVNLDAWNALSETQRAAIESLAAERQPVYQQTSKDEDDSATALLVERGIEVSAPDEAFSAALSEAAQPQWQAFRQSAGSDADALIGAYLEARDQ
ncbi:TRAP transporter substrate-binding protein [Halotalea alkalilenta]|uniref:TRAP transporter substrate-binding protein n=1 Tax=Halotalea alkalilenta TaxID=376489 RepID=UPI0005BA9986|nr:TRAP transporter substrate-binding protein [Halotalea alkalilenta]